MFQVNGGATATFQNLTIGGVGYTTGLDMNPDGTMYNTIDVYGGYVGNTTLGTSWQQLVTQASMPAIMSATPYLNGGLVGVASCPTNSQIVYMYRTGASGRTLTTVFYSTNKGATWTQGGGFTLTNDDSNDLVNGRQTNAHVAVDPNNCNVAYVGTDANGLWLTLNGGTTWSQVAASCGAAPCGVPVSYVAEIAFDKTSGTTTLSGVTVTARVICGVNGSGIYTTTNGGNSWSLVASSATNPAHGKIGSDGTYYFTTQNVFAANHVWRMSTSNVLTDITPDSGGYVTVIVDPNNPARVIADLQGGGLNVPTTAVNSGTPTWTGVAAQKTIGSGDVPWIQARNDGFLSDGEMFMDPFAVSVTGQSQTITSTPGNLPAFTVAAGLNLAANDVVRVTNTGTPGNYMLGTVFSYSGTSLVIAVGSVAPGGYLGAASGGSGTFTSWTITKERIWFAFGSGMLYTDAFFTTNVQTQTWHAKTLGMESSDAVEATWNGNALAVSAADRGFFAFPGGPKTASPASVPNVGCCFQSSFISAASDGSAFLGGLTTGGAAQWGFSSNGGSSFSQWAGFPALSGVAGPIQVENSSNAFGAGRFGLLSFTNNGGTTWSIPSGPLPAAFFGFNNGAAGSGYSVSSTGTMTWSGSGCSTNPVLNVTTSSTGDFNAANGATVNSVATAGVCTVQPSSAATTWTPSGIGAGSGATFTLAAGWASPFSFFSPSHPFCIDTSNNNYYAYNLSNKVFTSSNHGATWTLVGAGPAGAAYPILKCAPGQAGNLFFSGGNTQSNATYSSFAALAASMPSGQAFYRSVNGGTSWVTVSNVNDVAAFDLGAAAPGKSYPALYVMGWVNCGVPCGSTFVYGLFESDNFTTTPGGETWKLLTNFPARNPYSSSGWTDIPLAMAANPTIYGQLVVGYSGSGFSYFGP